MTPKEKAEELCVKYYKLFNNFPNYQYVIENLNTIQDEKLYTTKQCALIAADEILDLIDEHNLTTWDAAIFKFWFEVRLEIKQL
jgi:hypothetical protein